MFINFSYRNKLNILVSKNKKKLELKKARVLYFN